MLDINLDDIDFNFREKLVDEVSIVAGNILKIHGLNNARFFPVSIAV
ncbi:hypothetical protein L8106_27204 [Lyngbya sp. PCC 8106]|nr:hypothetical protein L8106_27204 [Lyngbya sp. PCC 8106]